MGGGRIGRLETVVRDIRELDDLELFDPLAPKTHADPYPIYAALRAEGPVHRTPRDAWLVLAYQPAVAILRDHDRFSVEHSKYRKQRDDAPLGPTERGLENIMLFKDPPDHTRLRTLVNKAFTPRSIANLAPRTAEISRGLLDAVTGRGEMDLAADYAVPLPTLVIAEMLGIPASDRGLLRPWSADICGMFELNPPEETARRAVRASVEFSAYLRELIAVRRKDPGEDLISALIAAHDEGGDRLSEQEMISTCVLLLNAGHEATVNTLGNGIRALMTHPEQWERLVNGTVFCAAALEELIRFDPPLQLFERWVLEDGVEVAGASIPRGAKISMLFGAANRDPRVFADPDRFDVARPNAAEHIGFGGGIHVCIGAPLARVELEASVRALVERCPNLELAEEPRRAPAFVIWGLERVEVKLS